MGSILKCKIEIRKETNASLTKGLGQYTYSTIYIYNIIHKIYGTSEAETSRVWQLEEMLARRLKPKHLYTHRKLQSHFTNRFSHSDRKYQLPSPEDTVHPTWLISKPNFQSCNTYKWQDLVGKLFYMVTDLGKSLILHSKRSGSICLEYFLLRASSLPGAARRAVLALKRKWWGFMPRIFDHQHALFRNACTKNSLWTALRTSEFFEWFSDL